MFSLSRERFMKYLLTGGFIGFAYSFLSHARTLPLKLVDSLFVAGMFPLLYGGCLVAKNLGMFHLFVYSHRKLWKYGKRQEKEEAENEKTAPDATEKLGTYSEYLAESKPSGVAEPLLAGGIWLALSLILTFLYF